MEKAGQETEARKGALLGVFIIIGMMAVGVATHFFWQHYSKQKKVADRQPQYLTLGDQTLQVGESSMLVKFTIEYVGGETGKALAKALPAVKGQVTKRMVQIQDDELQKLRSIQGKRELAEDVLVLVREALPGKASRNVKEILYEKFLIGE